MILSCERQGAREKIAYEKTVPIHQRDRSNYTELESLVICASEWQRCSSRWTL